jgi:Fe-S oxidoreductase
LVRSEWTEKMFGPQVYQAFQEVKAAFDPQGIMNPGKIVGAPRMDENLRYGPGYQTIAIETHFDFSRDGGLAGAVELCSGVGACRKRFEGTMCPSYRATMDERHTTRARANMLRAVISGALPPEELTGPGMHDVMDLCLECKACKAECPSNVDMAKLKAEFLAHSNAAHGTSLRTQMFAHVAASSRLASRIAPLANWALRLPLTKRALHRFAGVAPERDLPTYAAVPFPDWFRRHRPHAAAGTRGTVALLNDTFLNYHEPEIGIAATRVLEACGYAVELTDMECCARPQISKGLLTEARAAATRNLVRLKSLVDRGLPILGCEPSCLVTLKDEYVDLVGGDDARAVADASELVEAFLARSLPPSLPPPFSPRPARALLHGHCHQKALLGTRSTLDALRLIPGLEVSEIPSGCCGMAGSFGFEAEHYEVSMKIGEETLFPTIRETPAEVLLIAPGASCRQQIRHATGRVAHHPLVVLAEALSDDVERQTESTKQNVTANGRRETRDLALRLVIGGVLAGAAVLVAARTLGARENDRHDAEIAQQGESEHG